MKLFSQNLELKALASIAVGSDSSDGATISDGTSPKEKISSYLLSSLSESFFHYEPCRSAFKRITRIAEKKSRILHYDDLLEDPTLDEEFRDVLRENKKKRVKTLKDAQELFTGLDSYRKVRIIYELSKKSIESLKDSKVDAEKLLDYASEKINEARTRDDLGALIQSVGSDDSGYDLIDRALDMQDEPLFKTGYKEFDDKTGGMPKEGVFLLGATTSGGKSVMRMNLMKNFYLLNSASALTVSLEMSDVKETHRLLSNLTGIDFWKFRRKKLSKDERKVARKAWRKFHDFGKQNNCRYSLMCPTRGMTIKQLLTVCKPYKYDVIAIDYVSLLEGVDEDNQARVLSSILRQCKIFSAENKCLVVVLVQVDDTDDRIRYSRGMREHADFCWIWNYSRPEQRELKVLPIKQLKARDADLFPFELSEQFQYMRVENLDSASGHPDDPNNSEKEPKKKSKNSSSERSKPDDDLGTGDDSDPDFDVD